MSELTPEQQLFVLYQIRNWLLGDYEVFRQFNAAWGPHGAEAYF